MTTNIHSINLPKIVQIGWGHHVDFRVWKNRPLLLAKGVDYGAWTGVANYLWAHERVISVILDKK